MLNQKYLFLTGFLFITVTVFSQLGNLTTQQVGTVGLFMGGSLVAAESNNAGLFYNPASVSSNSLFSFSFNTSVFRAQFLNFNNGFGPDTEFSLSSSRFESPFFSMMLPTKNKYHVKFSFGTFSHQNVDYNFFNRVVVDNPFPQLNHTNGRYEGIYSYTLKSSEQWVVFAASKRMNEKILLGSSLIIALRSLTYIISENASYLFESGPANKNFNSLFVNEDNAYLYDYKLILKFGGIYIIDKKNRVGLTIMTPSLSVINSARNFRSIQQTNINLLMPDPDNPEYQDFKISNSETGLEGNYKTALNISLGYDFQIDEKEVFSFAINYYSKISPYNLISGKNNKDNLVNTSNIDVNDSFLNLLFGQRSIVNFSFGYKTDLSEKIMLLTGFRTNFSTTKKNNYSLKEEALSIVDLKSNLYSISGGITFTVQKNKFIVGTDFGFSGGKDQDPFVNFSNPLVINNRGIPLRGNINPIMKQTIFSIGFVFGYSFVF